MSADTSAVGVRRAFVPGQRITEQIAKQLDYESLQSFCSTEKQVYEFCQSDIGRIIMAEKYREFNIIGVKKLVEIFENYAGAYTHPTKTRRILLEFNLMPFNDNTVFHIELEPDMLTAPNRIMRYRIWVTVRNAVQLYEVDKVVHLDEKGVPLSNPFFDDCQAMLKKTLIKYNETNKSEGYLRYDVNNVVLDIATVRFSCNRTIGANTRMRRDDQEYDLFSVDSFFKISIGSRYDLRLVPSQAWAENALLPLLEKYLNLPVSLGVLGQCYRYYNIETPPEKRGNIAPVGANVRRKIQVADNDSMEVLYPRTGSTTYADTRDSQTQYQSQSTSRFTHSHSAWLDQL